MVTHYKIIWICAIVPRMEPLPLYWLCQQMPKFVTRCLLTISYPIFSYPLAIHKMCYSYIWRSSSQRPTYKTSASASKDYISVTPGKYEEGFLSEDYVTLTGNTNSSSDADFLADMFDRTAQVYRHHLRYVCGIRKLHHSLYDKKVVHM
jgi:hypothetical protein